MDIWILNHYAITPDMPGGTRHYDFGKELVKRGYRVTIFASSFHYLQRKELKLKKNEEYKVENVNGINFVWIKTFSYQKNDWRRVLNMISYMWQSYWIGRKINKRNLDIKKPDVIIGSSVHLLAVLSAYFLSKYHKAKFVMEIRDLWPQTLIDVGAFKKNSSIVKILSFIEKFLYKKSKGIIILSPLTKKYLKSLGVDPINIYFIPNGVDISKYRDISCSDTKDREFKILYAGALGVFNAVDPTVEAMKIIQEKKLEDIKFVFIGEGVEKKKLAKKIEELKVKNIKLCSLIPKDKMISIFEKADIFLLIEKKTLYGSSNKLMDYMATGRPIIFSTFAKHNNFENINCGISIPPGDAENLAEAIIRIYRMPNEERKKIGQRGREYVEKYHSIPVLVDKLEKVIKEVINE